MEVSDRSEEEEDDIQPPPKPLRRKQPIQHDDAEEDEVGYALPSPKTKATNKSKGGSKGKGKGKGKSEAALHKKGLSSFFEKGNNSSLGGSAGAAAHFCRMASGATKADSFTPCAVGRMKQDDDGQGLPRKVLLAHSLNFTTDGKGFLP